MTPVRIYILVFIVMHLCLFDFWTVRKESILMGCHQTIILYGYLLLLTKVCDTNRVSL